MFIRMTKVTVKLTETAQGHLIYPMAKNVKDTHDDFVKDIHLARMKKKYTMRDLKKISRVLGNPTTEKISKLMKDAGEYDSVMIKILKMIHNNCPETQKIPFQTQSGAS